jgi:hypothetical protein
MEPERGFYYHYKHTDKSINNYAYEVLNIAHHSEIEDLDEGALVIYCPLYETKAFSVGKHWYARPLKMFMETVIKDGKEMKRFTKITDLKVISELEKIKEEMYE